MDTLIEPVFRWTLGGLLVVGLGLRAYFQRQARGVTRVGRLCHPMYSAFFVMGFGLLLLSANWLLGLIHLGAVTAMYRARVDDEETLMREHFGDAYGAYLARTGRLLPRHSIRAQPTQRA